MQSTVRENSEIGTVTPVRSSCHSSTSPLKFVNRLTRSDNQDPDIYKPMALYRRESEPMLPFSSAYEDLEARHATQDSQTPQQWLPLIAPQSSPSPYYDQCFEDVYESQAQSKYHPWSSSGILYAFHRSNGRSFVPTDLHPENDTFDTHVEPQAQSLSLKYPHNSFLSLLDPKVNRNSRRKVCSKSEM